MEWRAAPADSLARTLVAVLEPAAAALQPYAQKLQPLLSPALAVLGPRLRFAAQWTNQQLVGLEAWQLVLLTAVVTLLAARLWRALRHAAITVQDKGVCTA